MITLGLTGGIATGKSTVAKQFSACGAKLSSADAVVHALLAPGGAAEKAVAARFPGAIKGGHIDRRALAEIVYADAGALKDLERILHPLVRAAQKAFARRMQRLGARLVVLEIPLLYESGAQAHCDYVAVTAATRFLQHYRARRRMHVSQDRLHAIVARQMPEREKQRRADFIVHTGLGKGYSFAQVKRIVEALR